MEWGTVALEVLGDMVTNYMIDSIYNSSIVTAGGGDVSFSSMVSLSGFYIWREINQTYTSRPGSIYFNSDSYYDSGQSVVLIEYPDGNHFDAIFTENDGFISLTVNSSSCFVRVSNGDFGLNGVEHPSTTQLTVLSTPPTIIQQNLVNGAMNYPGQACIGAVKGVLGSNYRNKNNGKGGKMTYPAWMTNDSIYAFPEGGDDIKNLDDLNIYLPIIYQDWYDLYQYPFYIEPELFDILPVGTILPNGEYKTEDTTEPTEPTEPGGYCCQFDYERLEAILASLDFKTEIDYQELASVLLAGLSGLDVNATLDYDALSSALVGAFAGIHVNADLDYNQLVGALVNGFADTDFNVTFDYDKLSASLVNAFNNSDINIKIDLTELESILKDLELDIQIDYDEIMSPSEFKDVLDGFLIDTDYQLNELETLSPDEVMQLSTFPQLPAETLSPTLLQALPAAAKTGISFYDSLGWTSALIATGVTVALIKMLRGH